VGTTVFADIRETGRTWNCGGNLGSPSGFTYNFSFPNFGGGAQKMKTALKIVLSLAALYLQSTKLRSCP
jgi:hypothetical protein